MDIEKLVARINQLARKQKSTGLNEEEKLEQQRLRRTYIDAFRRNLKSQLDQIRFVDKE